MMAVVTGHDVPKETFYDIKSKRFMVNEYATVDTNGKILFK